MADQFRTMCVELIEAVLSDDSHIDCMQIARRARALLAEPVAEGPTDEDLVEALRRLLIWPPRSTEAACEQDYTFARAVLARWGRPTPQPAVLNDIGQEWRPCVKLPITVHVRDQRPGETHSSTREGITPLRSDDLIMRGVQGEEYPIGRDLFEQTYELLPTPEATSD